ncbi:hypothetical protein K1719_038488 [Acacia pycnantha]|nr:hypothetical protein K1719_038488 [Acacia pycnantha]
MVQLMVQSFDSFLLIMYGFGLVGDELRSFLEINLPKVKEGKKAKFSLGVVDPKIGSQISEVSKIPCQSNEFMGVPTIPTTSLPASSGKFPQISARGFGNQNCVAQRHNFQAKSTDADVETSEPSTSIFVNNDNASSFGPSTSFLSLLCPLLKLFSGGDPSQQRNYSLEAATSSLASLARFAWGSKSVVGSSMNKEITSNFPTRLQLYEFEACPFCRRDREALTELDLTVEVYPCPKGPSRHREVVKRSGGREQFPFLIDPNNGISMHESGDIVKYLFERYGGGRSPSTEPQNKLGFHAMMSFCSHHLLNSSCITGGVPTIPTTSLPASSVKFPKFLQEGLAIGIALLRDNFQAKSKGAGVETSEPSTSISVNNGNASSSEPSTSFLSLLCPLLKLFSGGDPSQQRHFTLEVEVLQQVFWRAPCSLDVGCQHYFEQAEEKLELLSYENNALARIVREALCELELIF